MLDIATLKNLFPMILPIADKGVVWNGCPDKWSNLPLWHLDFSQRFAMNVLNYAQFGLNGHNGIDIAFSFRCPIVAPCRIYITTVINDKKGYGNHVWAETETKTLNGETVKLELVFGHFDEITAEPYKWYDAGDLIGYGDSTGFSTGDHLHFGIRPWLRTSDGNFKQMFLDNGFLGYTDPEPFLPHIVWDLRELLNKPIPMNLSNLENYLVQLVEAPGGFGLIVGGRLIVDDLAKILASWQMRNKGNVVGKTTEFKKSQWDSVYHYNLKLEVIYKPE